MNVDNDTVVKTLVAEVEAVIRDSSHVPVMPPMKGDLGKLSHAIVELRELLEARFTQLRKLMRLTEQVNSGVMLEEVLGQVFLSFRDVIPYDRIGVALVDQDGGMVRARWARSNAASVCLPVGFAAPMHGSSLQKIMETGEPRIINDLDAYLAAHPHSTSTRLVLAEGVKSSLTFPLTAMGKRVGFMFFSSFARGTYSTAHAELFSAIAGQLSTIIEKGRIYEMVLESQRETERLLASLTRLNAGKARLFAMVVHDLKSPFSGVQGMLEFLVNDAPNMTREQIQQDLKLLSTSASETFSLMENLLQWSTFETGDALFHPEVQPLDNVVNRVFALVRAAALRKSIELELVGNPGVSVKADKSMLHSVLQNLISNAIKFTDGGGKVRVESLVIGKWVDVSVSDTGMGMTPEALARVLERDSIQSTLGTAGERGTGLGLGLCRNFVERHGGLFRGESEAGQGTTFTFSLPLG